MAKPSEKEIAEALLGRHGRTFSQELGIPVERNTPSSLFLLLCASLLFSAMVQREDQGADSGRSRQSPGRPRLDQIENVRSELPAEYEPLVEAGSQGEMSTQ